MYGAVPIELTPQSDRDWFTQPGLRENYVGFSLRKVFWGADSHPACESFDKPHLAVNGEIVL